MGSTGGHYGICHDTLKTIPQRGGSFRVRLKISGQRISYGSYQDLAEAMKVRNEAYRKVFGEFSFFG